jgi:hypothetical protein
VGDSLIKKDARFSSESASKKPSTSSLMSLKAMATKIGICVDNAVFYMIGKLLL